MTSIPGVGARLAALIEEIHRTGRSELLEKLRAQFPPGTVELIDIPNLGLRKIARLHQSLGVSSREDLRRACEAGRVRDLPGFDARSEQKLLAALTQPDSPAETHLLFRALSVAELLISELRSCATRVEVVGAARRCVETVDRLELVALADDGEVVLDRFVHYADSIAMLSRDESSASIRLLSGPVVALRVTAADSFANICHYCTGSAAHVRKLQARATADGLSLEPDSLRDERGRRIAVSSDAEIYARLGLQAIPPELREDTGEIEEAARGKLPSLIEARDVRGMVHVHTLYSDGRNTIEEMARAAEDMGMTYLTITDHSQSASYAGGLSFDQVRRQWDEIAAVQERVNIRLLRGTESDILRDGSLDYADANLERFDVIIASIHARHHLNRSQMTSRIMRAIQHPAFKIWGHPLGRLLNHRPPIECDVDQILDAIAGANAAIEINGDPYRLDLEPRWVRAARSRGIKFVLSTDAHSARSLLNLRFAVAMARRGGLSRDDVLNALPAAEFSAAVRPSSLH